MKRRFPELNLGDKVSLEALLRPKSTINILLGSLIEDIIYLVFCLKKSNNIVVANPLEAESNK